MRRLHSPDADPIWRLPVNRIPQYAGDVVPLGQSLDVGIKEEEVAAGQHVVAKRPESSLRAPRGISIGPGNNDGAVAGRGAVDEVGAFAFDDHDLVGFAGK